MFLEGESLTLSKITHDMWHAWSHNQPKKQGNEKAWEGGEFWGKKLKKGGQQYTWGLHKIEGVGALCQLWPRFCLWKWNVTNSETNDRTWQKKKINNVLTTTPLSPSLIYVFQTISHSRSFSEERTSIHTNSLVFAPLDVMMWCLTRAESRWFLVH